MKYVFLLLLTCSSSFLAPRHDPMTRAVDKLPALKANVLTDILATPVNEAMTIAISGKLNADGSWADIDYADKTRGGWPVNDHLVRLNNMAILYRREGSRYKGDDQLKQKILLGLNYWFRNDFICPNWWYPEIGVPKVLGPTMLLLEDKLSAAEKESGIKILNRAKIGMTGQNRVWLSGNVIYRSLLTGDSALIQSAVDAIAGEVIVSEKEGIQPDNSFHQHGPQQQFGNYGAAFAGDILKWANIFQHTAFQFNPEKVSIMRNYLLEGMRWIVWKDKMDISACGRQLFLDAQVGKANNIKNVLTKMPLVDPAFSSSYKTALGDFSGDRHFWRSDMTVHRRPYFYTSVKMSSKRVGGAESCNDENLQGYHLGDGATYFYQSGDEYTNIFPFWDWKMIPGTTAFHDAKPLPVLPCSGYRIASDFVGGVSDSTNGIATLAYTRDSLNAQKSWFFFNDATICLGAGIGTQQDKPVLTTINQSFLHGDVQVKQGTGTTVLQPGEHILENVPWTVHDRWGYYFPGGAALHVANHEQEGNWQKVVKSMPSKIEKASLFTLWIDHKTKPVSASYAYYVFPGATEKNIGKMGAAISVAVNTPELQVVEIPGKNIAGFVFVKAGEAGAKDFGKLSSDKPCVVMITGKGKTTQLSVADPTHLQSTLVLGLAGKHASGNPIARYDNKSNTTYFTIALPTGPEAGKTVQLSNIF